MSKYAPIKTIIFDLGGVLIDWNPRYLYNKVFDDQQLMETFLKEIDHDHWNANQDAGGCYHHALKEKIQQCPKWAKELSIYLERWPEMISGPIQPTVDILQSLYTNRKVHLYALTNWSKTTWPIALELFSFLNFFNGIVVSGQENVKKPDPQIFEIILKRYQIDPKSTLFIDDVADNIATAKKVGLQVHHYQQSDALLNSLKAHQLL